MRSGHAGTRARRMVVSAVAGRPPYHLFTFAFTFSFT
jgi:hypothetical protein